MAGGLPWGELTTAEQQPNKIIFSRLLDTSVNSKIIAVTKHTAAQPYQDFLREPEQPMAWGPSQGYYGRF